MDILVKQVRIIDPSSPLHQQTVDLLVQNNFITRIGAISQPADHELAIDGLCVSPGWMDVFANFCDPGFEYKETLQTGAAAAASGGYTDVLLLPNTAPVVHNKAGIEYITQRSKQLPVTVHPLAAITKNCEGKELAEMYDMHDSGAVAFTDGTNSVQSAGLLLKALQYIKAIDKTIIQLPDNQSINSSGLMNEGIVSTQLGLPGKPAIAEEIRVARDIELVKYTGSKLHFTGVSTARALALIRLAKNDGVPITCSVTPYHICFTDEDLRGYDTNLKVNPPLRTKADQQAVHEAILDGTVDCIATHHLPQDPDHKVVEFEYAQYGMLGLETCFAVLRTYLPQLPIEQLVRLLAISPRNIFGLPQITIAEGSAAALSLFLPDEAWNVDGLQSKSKNSPFLHQQLTGKPIGIINKDSLFLKEF
jgi:dihydroorotase